MARVHLLDDELINKIAAGEVVERPASVVKELVENAIDAGATHVKVILRDGGRVLIQVQDDGVGMAPEDAVLAVKRHTTSKLRAADDLFQVKTMGFRGEALASIASVSRFTLQTQSLDQPGHRVQIEDGKQTDGPWQGSPGTTMTVADLFYNVPARRAFLKTSAAEFAACHEYMQALALSLPGLGFTLLHNDREVFSVSPALKAEGPLRGEVTMRARAAAMIGAEDAARLIYVQRPDKHGLVEALIAPPGLDRSTARHCFTFVNGRWVRDKLLRFALQRGYHSHLMKGKFPIAVVYLTVDPTLVDVNVHPAKAELRFQYAQEVQNAVVYAIRDALRDGDWAAATPNVRTPENPLGTGKAPAHATGASPTPRASKDTSGTIPPEDFDLYLPQNDETRRTVMRFEAETPRAGATAEPASSPAAKAPPAPAGRDEAWRSARPSVSASSRDASPAARSDRDLSVSGSSPSTSSTPRSDRDSSSAARSSVRDLSASGGPSSSSTPRSDRNLSTDASPANRASAQAASPGVDAAPQASAVSDLKARYAKAAEPAGKIETRAPAQQTLPGFVTASDGQTSIPWAELQYIGPFAKCFLLFEHGQQMLAIDQHAFHERVLYERLLENPDILRRTQPLLMPEVLSFSPMECERLVHMKDTLAAIGIHLEGVSETEIEVTAVPSLLVNKDLSSLLAAILGGKDKSDELAHDVLATMACHAAVRAGEELPDADLKNLLKEAETVNFYHNCPHGRRVFRWWKLAQVAAWFDR